MIDYNRQSEELRKIEGFDEVIFDYEKSMFSDEFKRIFDFYTETLKGHSDFGIIPAYIFFVNDSSVNAWAWKLNNNYIVNINSGTIEYLKKKYQALDVNNTAEIESIKDYIGTDVKTLMFEFSMHFTFYHEMAHLIQNSEFLESNMMEVNSENYDYDERIHLLELDADMFSSLSVSAHILDLFDTNFNNNMEKFCDLLKVLMSTGINYVLSFNSDNQEFYLKNPHIHTPRLELAV